MNLKDVSIGGGQLRLRLPAAWKESAEEDGSTAFFDETADVGTLRVKVMTFTTDEDLSKRTPREQLEDMEPEPAQIIESLASGNAVRVHRETGDDDGQPTEFHVWLLAGVDPPHRLHLAIFTFTVLAKDAEKVKAAIASLNDEIKNARFAHQVS